MQDYHKRFLELARFAPRIVPTEADRVEKFIDGMNYETQKMMVAANCQTLNEAYTLASKHYHICMKQKNVGSKKRKVEESRTRLRQEERKFQPQGQGFRGGYQYNPQTKAGFSNAENVVATILGLTVKGTQ